MADRDWRDLLLAARSSWIAYVLSWRWLLFSVSAMAVGAFLGGFLFASHDFSRAWQHLFVSGFFTWGLGSLVFFRVLFRSIDFAGKRKLARQIGLLVSTQPA